MAKGGSGDLLTGLIAGMLAQYPGDAARAVEAAVYLHGLAADLAVRAGQTSTRCWRRIVCANLDGFSAFVHVGQTDMFGCRGCRQMRCGGGLARGFRNDRRAAQGRFTNSRPRAARTRLKWAASWRSLLKPPQLLLLRGDLGTGKTTLVKGIAEALDAAEADEVTSPTFTLLHEYDGTQDGKPVKLYHLDVYRLEGERQLETLGLDELLTPDALVLVEWGDKFKSIRKRATGEILITATGGDARKITVTLKD